MFFFSPVDVLGGWVEGGRWVLSGGGLASS